MSKRNDAAAAALSHRPTRQRGPWSLMAAALIAAMCGLGPTLAAAETQLESGSALGSYLAARLAQDLRDTEAAGQLLKIALDRDPGNPALLQQAFIAEMMDGNWASATRYAERALANDPGNHLAHIVLGVQAVIAGRLGDADKHFAEPGATPAAVLARAWVLDARKDTKGAAALLDKMTDQNWVRFFRTYNRALMDDADGNTAAAGTALAQLFTADPSAINVALSYAQHASHSGDNTLAKQILDKHSGSVQARHPLVDDAYARIARGEHMPLQVSSTAEGLSNVFYGFAQALSSQGGVDLALIYSRLALELRPNDELSQVSLAAIYEQLKQYDRAIAIYRAVPSSSPLHFDLSIREALNLNALERGDEAKAILLGLLDTKKAAADQTDAARKAVHAEVSALTFSGSGNRRNIKQLQTLLVRAGFDKVPTDGSVDRETKAALMQLQKDAGLPATGSFGATSRKALEDRIVARLPAPEVDLATDRKIDLYQTLGNMLRGRKDFAEAAEYYGKAIDLIGAPHRDNWDQFYSRGVCYERLNQWPKAEADFLKAIELNPEEPLILNYLGYSWVDRGQNIEKALDLIKKAVGLKPDDGYYVDSLGWAYYRMGRFNDAVEQLEHAVELKAEDPVINDHLGDAYWRAGRRIEARFQWSTSLTLKPEPEDVSRIEQKLKSGLPDDPAPGADAGAADKSQKQAEGDGKDKSKQP